MGKQLKSLIVLAAITAVLLTGCGEAPAASPNTEPAASSTPTETRPPSTMPVVAGKTYAQARDLLGAASLSFEVVGPEGKFTDRPQDSAIVLGADLKAGAQVPFGTRVTLNMKETHAVLEAQVAAEKLAAARAVRYTFNCSAGSAIGDKTGKRVHSFKEIWADPKFASFTSCDGRVGSSWWHDRYTLEADEKAVVDQISADGGDASSAPGAYSDVLAACLITPAINWEASKGFKVRVQAVAKSALRMCPDAPFVAELTRVANGEPRSRMDDGTYAVGQDIAVGTYQVQVPNGANGVHECYWERAGAQGGIIANNFISFAPQGPVVTVYAGEGFISRGCGIWRKIG
ncbi:PASTA domain-containing protein [Pseudarthrobacter sp. PH31-O2]|uniref:PASTA domain-containing protein n=1 Tax=Pseudarthrobacter sp. PH31-O2 TaxID=3046206 RepID=UPI0024B94A66|nr:PASTA domain-containing protein [Pseudarthrobacter sp. PH31-O2]MDJ0354421.1 PASTA domain-containing protein [Pseudarthrobacter sp. PH31-O2]